MWHQRWQPWSLWLPRLRCRPSLLWPWILAWLAMAPALGAPPPLTLASDLAADGRQAGGDKTPVVILFSRARCGWCDKARREHVNAMAANATNAAAGAIFRQVDMDRDTPLVDFAGRRTSHRAFAAAHRVRMTPTLMFFGGDGATLAGAIVGYRLPEFYGTLIEDAVEDSRNQLRGRQP
jgi:thioredoxin-related protein